MPYTFEKTAKNTAIFHLTIPKEALEHGVEHAAQHIGETLNVPGFRVGKAPADVVKKQVGENALLEHAVQELLQAAFSEAMLSEKIDAVGQPYFTMKKMAIGSDLECDVEIAIMPQVTKLADYKTLTVKKGEVAVASDVFEKSKKDLLRMATTTAKAPTGSTLAKNNKAVVSMTMKKDGVEVEGGSAKNHAIFTSEEYYVPGFVEAILGAKEGEERTFTLPFPTDHFQKHLAGQNIDFTVKIDEIHTMNEPLFDDALAQKFGLGSIAELEEKLRENLAAEKLTEEERRQEKELLELLASKSTFEEIPDLLINAEIDKMVEELKSWVAQQGIPFEDYLKNGGVTLAQIKLDFAPQALVRLKVALVLKAIATAEKIEPATEDVDAEIDRVAKTVEGNQEAINWVYSPSFRERVESQLRNIATIKFLKEKMVK